MKWLLLLTTFLQSRDANLVLLSFYPFRDANPQNLGCELSTLTTRPRILASFFKLFQKHDVTSKALKKRENVTLTCKKYFKNWQSINKTIKFIKL